MTRRRIDPDSRLATALEGLRGETARGTGRTPGLVYIKVFCDLGQERRPSRLDRIVGARVLGGPPSGASEISPEPPPSVLTQISYNPPTPGPALTGLAAGSTSQPKKPSLNFKPIFWNALVLVLILFYLLSQRGSDLKPPNLSRSPAASQKQSWFTPDPDSDAVNRPSIIPEPIENLYALYFYQPAIPLEEKTPPGVQPLSQAAESKSKEQLLLIEGQAKHFGEFFTVGLTNNDISATQKSPIALSNAGLMFGPSTMQFGHGRDISRYSPELSYLKGTSLPINIINNDSFIIIPVTNKVYALQGTPYFINNRFLMHGLSDFQVRYDRSALWYKSQVNPLNVRKLPSNITAENYFTVGSTKNEVLNVQGKPAYFNDQLWTYGASHIQFRDGRVISWHNSPLNPLKVKFLPIQMTSKEYFTVGSTKDEVLFIQGTPTSYDDQSWSYGSSHIQFRDGRVVSWYNSPLSPLKVQLVLSDSR